MGENCPRSFKREAEKYHTGTDDGLVPLKPLDLSEINDFDEMLRAMEFTAFGGRQLGEAAETLTRMIEDQDAFVVMTLSGAMTVGKMGLVICEMIERKFVHAIVSTGALMAHGFVESSGRQHFKYDPRMDDSELYKTGYDRVYDTLELEKNLDEVELIVDKILDEMEPGKVLSSHAMNRYLGKWLNANVDGRGVLKSAYLNSVPVYVPAFTDSELGLDLALYNRRRVTKGRQPLAFNPFLDLEHYTELINKQKKLGIFTIGGGVPRNWAQQVGPYLELIMTRAGGAAAGVSQKRFTYALRICPESVHWGGLSGCTYSEGVSWGKFVPVELGGRHTEVLTDATQVWPILIKGVIQRLEKRQN